MKKLIFIILLLSSIVYGAKNPANSFNRATIGVVLSDTTAPDTLYELSILNNLEAAGYTVKKSMGDNLVTDYYSGTNSWADLDLVIIPYQTTSIFIDTTKTIGDVPLLSLHPSTFSGLGFTALEAAASGVIDKLYGVVGGLYVVEYDTSGAVQDTIFTWNGTHGLNSVFVDDDSIYVGAEGYLYKMTHTGVGVDSFGGVGSGTGQFNSIKDIYKEGDYYLILDTGNSRFIKTKWNADSWVAASSPVNANTMYYALQDTFYHASTYSNVGYIRDYLFSDLTAIGNSETFSNILGISDLAVDTSGTVDTLYAVVMPKAAGDDVYIKKGALSAVTENLYKLEDTFNTSYQYNLIYLNPYTFNLYAFNDEDNNIYKINKFGVIQDTIEISVNLIDLVGYSSSSSNSEDITQANIVLLTDSIAAIADSIGPFDIYQSTETAYMIDSTGLTDGNKIAMDISRNTGVTIAIDTLNNVKRSVFGYSSIDSLTDTQNGGWTLFNRLIGRMLESEQDTVFSVAVVADSLSGSGSRAAMKTYFETNMHRVSLIDPVYGDSSHYDGTNLWSDFDLIWLGNMLGTYDSLIVVANDSLVPMISMYSTSDADFMTRFLVDTFEEADLQTSSANALLSLVTENYGQEINYYLGLQSGIDFDFYDDQTLPETFTLGQNRTVPFIFKADSVVNGRTDSTTFLLKYEVVVGTDTSNYYSFPVSNYYKRFMFPEVIDGSSDYYYNTPAYWTEDAWDLYESGLRYLFLSALLPPTGLTLTALSSDSVKVEWTDAATGETGYVIILKTGGDNYEITDKVISTLAANTTADTVFSFWPPNGKFIIDVAAYSAADTFYTVTQGDTVILEPASPDEPYVEPLSDSLFFVDLRGYSYKERFDDVLWDARWNTTRGYFTASNPYWRLKADSTLTEQTIWADVSDIDFRDTDVYASFKLNDTVYIDQQYWKMLFSTDYADTNGTGIYVYVDSSKAMLVSQTTGTPDDTLITGAYLTSFKWTDVQLSIDWEAVPSDTNCIYTLYVGADTIGIDTVDTQNIDFNYMTLLFSDYGSFGDNIFVQQKTPGANHDSTYYVVYDSLDSKYFSVGASPETLQVAADSGKFADWGSVNGDSVKTDSSESSIKLGTNALQRIN